MKINILFLCFLVMLSACEKKPEHTIQNVYVNGGESFEFQSNYSGGNKSVLWNFGDGHISSETNPIYSYTTPGTYPVTLTKYKNNKFVDKYVSYNVTVEQLYKPRVYKIGYYCQPELNNSFDEHRYFYKDYFAKFHFISNPEIESGNYRYEILFNETPLDTAESSTNSYFNAFQLTDTGYFDVSFTIFDENNISDTFDTTVYVGNQTTQLNLNIPEVYLPQLGTVMEKKILVYDNNDIYNYKDRDFQNAVNYSGPSAGNFVQTNPSSSYIYINNGTGTFWFDGDSYYGIDVFSIPTPNNNVPFTVEIPAHELDDEDDYDDIHLLVVVIGDLGMAYGQISLQILPGSNTPIYNLNLTFKQF